MSLSGRRLQVRCCSNKSSQKVQRTRVRAILVKLGILLVEIFSMAVRNKIRCNYGWNG